MYDTRNENKNLESFQVYLVMTGPEAGFIVGLRYAESLFLELL